MNIQKFQRRSYNAERKIMKVLRAYGIWSWRIPSSGFKTGNYALPDILAVPKGEDVLGFEVKTTEKDRFRETFDEDTPIITWLKNGKPFTVEPLGYLVVKFMGNNMWDGAKITSLDNPRFTFYRNQGEKLYKPKHLLKVLVDRIK